MHDAPGSPDSGGDLPVVDRLPEPSPMCFPEGTGPPGVIVVPVYRFEAADKDVDVLAALTGRKDNIHHLVVDVVDPLEVVEHDNLPRNHPEHPHWISIGFPLIK